MTDWIGEGSIANLGHVFSSIRPHHVLLFTGGRSFIDCGAAAAIEPLLDDISCTTIPDIRANPTIEAVEKAVGAYREAAPDLVLAIGGGSVIDVAKMARVLALFPLSPRDLVLAGIDRRPEGMAPLVAIPTTAGTGSETTHFSAVYLDGVKHSLAHESMRPEHVIVDPVFTHSMSPRLTGTTGLDALSQAIESYWSVHSTAESQDRAREAMLLARSNILGATLTPTPHSRAAMSKAAYLAGLAINTTFTTAAHALSYTLTAQFGVPHGHAVGLMLGPVIEYNESVTADDCTDSRGPDHVRSAVKTICSLFDADSASDAAAATRNLLSDLGLGSSLESVGAGSIAARNAIATGVNTHRLTGNPRAFTPSALARLVAAIP